MEVNWSEHPAYLAMKSGQLARRSSDISTEDTTVCIRGILELRYTSPADVSHFYKYQV